MDDQYYLLWNSGVSGNQPDQYELGIGVILGGIHIYPICFEYLSSLAVKKMIGIFLSLPLIFSAKAYRAASFLSAIRQNISA